MVLHLRGKEVWLEACFQDEVENCSEHCRSVSPKGGTMLRATEKDWQGAGIDLRWEAIGPQVTQVFHWEH